MTQLTDDEIALCSSAQVNVVHWYLQGLKFCVVISDELLSAHRQI